MLGTVGGIPLLAALRATHAEAPRPILLLPFSKVEGPQAPLLGREDSRTLVHRGESSSPNECVNRGGLSVEVVSRIAREPAADGS